MQRWQAGHLYRANCSWHVRYITAYDNLSADKKAKIAAKFAAKGKPIPSRVQESKRLCDGDLPNKIVRQLFTEFMEKINDQTPGQPQHASTSIVKFWDDIYWPFALENLKPSTSHGYKQVWSQHLKAHFGATLLNDYRTPMGSMFLTGLAKTYGKRTVQHVRSLASGIF